MKILVLKGSNRPNSNSSAMADAFVEAAKEAGHEVDVVNVAHKQINGCKACEYCHTKGEGKCIQKDDMQEILPLYSECEALVLASPIYYFTLSAQIEAALQRVYPLGKPPKLQKAAMILSSGSPGVYDASKAQFEGCLAYWGIESFGVVTAYGAQNGTEEKLEECCALAKYVSEDVSH